MRRIAVLYNPHSEISVSFSSEVADWLQARGLDVWRGVSHEGRDEHSVARDDLIIAVGGDGTVLRAARLAIPWGIPVLPLALGRLNFLAELDPSTVFHELPGLLEGRWWADERTLVDATVHHDGGVVEASTMALNEVIVSRGDLNRIVVVDVAIYDTHLTTYHADGVIVATATGSTAYALSAGGPIIDPRSQALVLVPVAAHLTSVPSLVLHEDAVVTLTLRSRHPVVFTADGHDDIELHGGDVVKVRRSQRVCTFARVYPQSLFYARMTQRLRPPTP